MSLKILDYEFGDKLLRLTVGLIFPVLLIAAPAVCFGKLPPVDKPAMVETNRNSTLNDGMFKLSISVDEKEFYGQSKLRVKAKIENISTVGISLKELIYVSFYLSKYNSDEVSLTRSSETYSGDFSLRRIKSVKEDYRIEPNEKFEFEVDLMSLWWEDYLLSMRGNRSVSDLPKGKYFLFMELSLPVEAISTKEDKFYAKYFSNNIPFELKDKCPEDKTCP
ncbi:MAG: hypothetical protein JSS81_03635 [Acidobacteria bacterium]|nr:hypothetical protein [Acidobacteriota bacterium]